MALDILQKRGKIDVSPIVFYLGCGCMFGIQGLHTNSQHYFSADKGMLTFSFTFQMNVF